MEYPLPTQVPAGGWHCFCCGEVFTDIELARDHFGTDSAFEPGCVERLTYDEKALRRQIIEMHLETERCQEAEHRARENAEELGDQVASYRNALARHFKGATTVSEARHLLDDTRGEVIAAHAVIAEIETIAPKAVAEARRRLKLYDDAYRASPSLDALLARLRSDEADAIGAMRLLIQSTPRLQSVLQAIHREPKDKP